MKLADKKILITGASSGIGLELAKEFFVRGSHLVLISRNKANLENTVKTLIKLNPGMSPPMILPCDITDMNCLADKVNYAINLLEGIDILINNAGSGVYGAVEKTTIEDFHSIMTTNFLGTVNMTLNTLPFMIKNRGGLIVNITSVAAVHGVPYLSAYSASKAAIVAFSQSIRAELKNKNINIMLIYPGYTETDFFRNEKNVGGARRPFIRYEPANKVAKAIIRNIEQNKSEKVLSKEGKALRIFNNFLTNKLVEFSMDKIAVRLRTK